MDGDFERAKARRTMAALSAVLSRAELQVLLLCVVERFSEREVAYVVHRSEQAVHTLLQRARWKTQEALAVDAHPGDR